MKRRTFLKNSVVTTAACGISQAWIPRIYASFQNPNQAVGDGINRRQEDRKHLRDLFYKPIDGRVGDVIPFYNGGKFRIFHLYKADNDNNGTTWHQVSTDNFVQFAELGVMLPRGTPDDQDLSVATGSVIQSGGRYHIFYTGYNSRRNWSKPEQGVMHAVSSDLLKWEKIPADTFYAPESLYERDTWRDPFVLWNEEAREYWMLVAARTKEGPLRRRGCTALCVSKDLTNWEVRDPFWSPGLYYTHECPDLFRMGDWWYLVFSEFSESNQTRYRMSRKITGPWIAPDNDTFDCRALYAAKSSSNGHNRFLFGWNPIRTGEKDDGHWEWGGNLVVHKLVQQPNGELSVKIPESIDRVFSSRLQLDRAPAVGKSEIAQDHVIVNAPQSFAFAMIAPLPRRCKITTMIEFTSGTRSCGLMLKLADDLDTCYYLRLEPARDRFVFDLWPRPGDQPFMTGFERPLKLTAGEPIEIKVVLDHTIAEFYVSDKLAMSTRMYSQNLGKLAVFVDEGTANFRKLGMFSMLEQGTS
jgi:beta-fructofuranosidase